MMIREALAHYAQQLPPREVELILCKVAQLTRAQLKTWPEKNLDETVLNQFHQCCQRRILGEPIAYIFNEREFWSLPLFVNSEVLIPRHETECLISYCVTQYAKNSQLHCIDLGTGSGAIVLALASQFPVWQLYAIERSSQALQVATLNAKQLNFSQVTFIQGNWLTCIQAETFDLVIANPPYIAPNDPHLRQGDLRYEPSQALVAPTHGFADLRQIIEQSLQVLKPKGQLILEHGFEQGKTLREILQSYGYQSIQTYQDDSSNERFTVAFK